MDLIKKWWFKWLLLGLIIRLILIPITLHADLWAFSFTAYFFSEKGVINVYEHLLKLPQDHPLVTNWGVHDIFIYPPLAYFTFGIMRILVKPFTDPNFIPWVWENLSIIHHNSKLINHIFWYKFPYLFFDIGLAFVIKGLFDDRKNKNRAFLLWILNPVTLYATFMIGQFDIIPVFFTVMALWMVKKQKKVRSMIMLGIASAYKTYPLFLIPAAAFNLEEKFWDRVKLIVLGLLPYLVSVGIFIGSPEFRQMGLLSAKSLKMLFMRWNVTGAEGIYPFMLGLGAIYVHSYYKGRKISLNSLFMAILLLTLSVTHFHPQWFLWVVPFMLISMIKHKFKYFELPLLIFLIWLALVFTFEPSLSYGLFNPIWPDLVKSTANLSSVIKSYFDPFVFSSILRSLFAAFSVYYSLVHLNKIPNEKEAI